MYWINHDSASITIQNVGTYQFVRMPQSYSCSRTYNGNEGNVGFSRGEPYGTGMTLYSGPSNNPSLFGWDMLTSIGPVTSNNFSLLQWYLYGSDKIATDGGVLYFSTRSGVSGTFQATIVPEPGTLGLLALGSLALVFLRRRR